MRRKPLEEYIGAKFNYLTIVGIDRERRKREGSCNTYVIADCDCGVCGKSYNLHKIKTGETKSCGHLKKKHDKPTKENTIIHKDGYGIIIANDKHYYFDLEDEHLLLNKYWYKDDYGYLTHCYIENRKNHYIRFHRLVLNAKKGQYVDHINRNVFDNRKSNLRICRHKDNDRNKGLIANNTSGVTGVSWDRSRQKWAVGITVDGKKIYLGRFDDKSDAIRARVTAEIKYFKDFAPQRELLV